MNEFFLKSSFDQAMELIKRFGFDEAKEQIMSYRGPQYLFDKAAVLASWINIKVARYNELGLA